MEDVHRWRRTIAATAAEAVHPLRPRTIAAAAEVEEGVEAVHLLRPRTIAAAEVEEEVVEVEVGVEEVGVDARQ